MIGRLTEGVNQSTVTITAWADNGSGGIQSGSLVTKTGIIKRDPTANTTVGMNTNKGNPFTVTAGSSVSITLTIDVGYYAYGRLMGVTDPTIYFRKLSGITILTGSFLAKKDGQSIPFSVSEYITSQGEEIIAVRIPAKIGYYFDGKKELPVSLSFDLQTNMSIMGDINLSEYMFFTTPENYYAAAN
jgi:hypothetical protein